MIRLAQDEKTLVQKTETVPETFHVDRGTRVIKDELELKHEREKILKAAEEMSERERAPQQEKVWLFENNSFVCPAKAGELCATEKTNCSVYVLSFVCVKNHVICV